jgi:hypothetical protein
MSQEGREQFAEVPRSDIVDLRTLLAHHYQRVDQNQVWVIATTAVPGDTRRPVVRGRVLALFGDTSPGASAPIGGFPERTLGFSAQMWWFLFQS